MAHSWRWHILHRHVITCWERADLLAPLCVVFLLFCHFPIRCLLSVLYLIVSLSELCPLLYIYVGKTNHIFLSETTRPRSLIFGMQHHLVRIYQFYSNWGSGTIKWTRLRAHTFTIGIYWENFVSDTTRHTILIFVM